MIISRVPALIGGLVILAVDFISVLGVVFQVQKYNIRVEELAEGMQQISNRLARAIFIRIEKRMAWAQPGVNPNWGETCKKFNIKNTRTATTGISSCLAL